MGAERAVGMWESTPLKRENVKRVSEVMAAGALGQAIGEAGRGQIRGKQARPGDARSPARGLGLGLLEKSFSSQRASVWGLP